jgi:hypothetical protein
MTEKSELKGKKVRSRWMRAILPNWKVITSPSKIVDMIWVSELDALCPGRDSPKPYKLAASMMSLMSLYILDMEGF